jgi:putative inorganic carbon (hco3(-)) transporter
MSANSTPVGRVGILLACASVGFVIFYLLKPTFLLMVGTLIVFGFLLLSIRWPDTGTLAVLFLLYTNIAVLAVRPPGAVGAAAGPQTAIALVGMWLILAVALLYQIFVRKQRLLFDRGFLLMLAFLAVCLASALFARDQQAIGKYIAGFVLEGLALFFLLTNVVRDYATLRRATWALLLAGSLMASFTIMQKVTHTERSNYGGFALMDTGPDYGEDAQETLERQRAAGKIGSGGELVGQWRAAGPVDASNLYAEILVVLLPLAVLQFRTEKSRALRLSALVAAGLIFGGLLLTFSRGALLTAFIVFLLMGYLGLLKLRHLLIGALAASLVIAVAQPTIVTRMLTLERINALFSGTDSGERTPDGSVILRYELDVAAWRVFLSHPFLGVGPGQFAGYYSKDYVNRIGMQQLTKGYQAHNLYFQSLAETGLIGTICFLSIMSAIMWALWCERSRPIADNSEPRLTAIAFFLALTSICIVSLFTHLIDQRYFWLLFALSSAAARIVHNSSDERAAEVSPEILSATQRFWLEAGDAPSH